MLFEARIYDGLKEAAAAQFSRRQREGQPVSGIKAVRVEVQQRSKAYMRGYFNSLDPSAGAIATDFKYYVSQIDRSSHPEMKQAWMAILAAVTLDHIEQTRQTPWQTAAFLSDVNEAAHSGTPIPVIKKNQLVRAALVEGGADSRIPGELWVSDKITNLLIRRCFGLETGYGGGQVWTPAVFFDNTDRMGVIKPVRGLMCLFPKTFSDEFLLSGRRLGGIASGLERNPFA